MIKYRPWRTRGRSGFVILLFCSKQSPILVTRWLGPTSRHLTPSLDVNASETRAGFLSVIPTRMYYVQWNRTRAPHSRSYSAFHLVHQYLWIRGTILPVLLGNSDQDGRPSQMRGGALGYIYDSCLSGPCVTPSSTAISVPSSGAGDKWSVSDHIFPSSAKLQLVIGSVQGGYRPFFLVLITVLKAALPLRSAACRTSTNKSLNPAAEYRAGYSPLERQEPTRASRMTKAAPIFV